MSVEDIVVTGGDLACPYKVLGGVSARVQAATVISKAPTVEQVDAKLRYEASRKRANAVINVTYKRGISAFSWKALTAYGTAVVTEDTDRKCPYCAEMIKREARVCRFCGRDVEPEGEDAS